MARSKYVDFKEVKETVSMTDILDHYDLTGSLVPKDDSLIGQCPIHKGTSPTQFRVLISKSWWNCFGPCEGGNILDFVAGMEEVSIREAAVKISEWFALSSKKARVSSAEHEEPSQKPETPEIPETQEDQEKEEATRTNTPLTFELKNLDAKHPAIVELGFDESVSHYFGAGVCSKGLMKGRLAIPIHSPTGELLAYVGRSLRAEEGQPESYRYPENFHKELELYNIHRALESGDCKELGLFLVPYPLDVWRFNQAGFENVVATMATTLSDPQSALTLKLMRPSAKLALILTASTDQRALLTERYYVRYLPGLDLASPAQALTQIFHTVRD